MKRLRSYLGDDSGEGLISGLILLAGVLIPMMFLVAIFGRLEAARLTTQQAARDAVRSAVQAPTPDQASARARDAVARARGGGMRLGLALDGRFEPGEVMTAHVSTSVALASIPLLGDIGEVSVHSTARAPVDRYRSVLTSEGGP